MKGGGVLRKKQGAYPSKVTMNLAMKERTPFSPAKLLPPLLILTVLAGLFGKFAVADRLAAVDRAGTELSALRQQQAALEQSTAGFDELSRQYARYATGWMTEDEQAAVPRTEMLELVESELMPGGQVRRLSASGNILSVELGGVTLEDTARFVQKLYQRPDVTNVAVYTASTRDGSVSMIVTMCLPGEGGDRP